MNNAADMQRRREQGEQIGRNREGVEFSPEHRARISESLMGHRVSLQTRLKISRAHRGKRRIRNGPLPSRTNTRRSKGGATRSNTTPAYEIDLYQETALQEMTVLKAEVESWMRDYTTRFGRKPSSDQVSRLAPEIYSKFMQYLGLKELVRQRSNLSDQRIVRDDDYD